MGLAYGRNWWGAPAASAASRLLRGDRPAPQDCSPCVNLPIPPSPASSPSTPGLRTRLNTARLHARSLRTQRPLRLGGPFFFRRPWLVRGGHRATSAWALASGLLIILEPWLRFGVSVAVHGPLPAAHGDPKPIGTQFATHWRPMSFLGSLASTCCFWVRPCS